MESNLAREPSEYRNLYFVLFWFGFFCFRPKMLEVYPKYKETLLQ